jgi:paraquat-inducible protein A
MTKRSSKRTILALVAVDAALLGLGLVAPALIVHPSAGKLTPLLKMITPSFGEQREASISGGIRILFQEGEVGIGSLLLIFSVLFPLAKLGALWTAACDLDLAGPNPATSRAAQLAAKLAKYSMLDVLVLALLVITLKRLPGGTSAEVGSGALFFALSVALSVAIPQLLKISASSTDQA